MYLRDDAHCKHRVTETDFQDASSRVYTNIDGLPYWLQHRHRKVYPLNGVHVMAYA